MKYNTITKQTAETVPSGVYGGVDYHGSPPDDVAERAGWVDVTPEIQTQIDADKAHLDAEAAAAEKARINGLAWKYGGLVGALSAYLARVGWTIPCEAEAVTADLLQRDLGGLLTADQKDAKSNVADTHMMLREAGISNADIAAIWERVKP
jgi:hypothetical protein